MTAMPVMGAPGLPMGGAAPGGMPVDPSSMILTLLQDVMGKWQSGQMQIAGEQSALAEVLMQLAGGGAPSPQQGFAEGGPSDNFGMGAGAPAPDAGAPVGY